MGRWPVLLVGVAILIAVMAHDAVMAIDVHGAPAGSAPEQQLSVGIVVTSMHGTRPQPDVHTPGLPTSPNATPCDATPPATPPPVTVGVDLPFTILPTPTMPVPMAISSGTPSLVLPIPPPAIRRALLQVYLN